jgi:hypothetical protein
MNFRDPLGALREPATIRARCAAVTRAVEEGRSGHFKLDRSRLPDLAQRAAVLAREHFADLKTPHLGQWGRFGAGGLDRKGELDALLAPRFPAERLHAHIDLTVVSVLLGAGAGRAWRYVERPELDALALPVHRQKGEDLLAMLGAAAGKAPAASTQAAATAPDTAEAPATEPPVTETSTTEPPITEPPATEPPVAQAHVPEAPAADPQPKLRQLATFSGTEGLSVAVFRAFVAGVFSSDPADPLRVDALALKRLDAAALRAVFQSSPSNPLPGLEARAAVLTHLGEVLQEQAERHGGLARPARLIDSLSGAEGAPGLTATQLLREVQRLHAPAWISGSRVLGLPAGDVWPHLWAGAATDVTLAAADPGAGAAQRPTATDRATAGWVPFHLLGQWMTYSLVEPLGWAGLQVSGLEALTALPEIALGARLVDAGVIVPRHPGDLTKTYKPSSDLVVEWRALTVTLMDELAGLVRELSEASAQWEPSALNRGAAAPMRDLPLTLGLALLLGKPAEDAAPPLKIDSDGTLF